jgi:hypothetical protein
MRNLGFGLEAAGSLRVMQFFDAAAARGPRGRDSSEATPQSKFERATVGIKN